MKLELKNAWAEVTLGEYMDINNVLEDKELKNRPLKQNVMMAAILSGKTVAEIEDIDHAGFTQVLNSLEFMDTVPLVSAEPTFLVKGDRYIFHPDFSKLTTGEMISIETVLGDAEKGAGDSMKMLLAILIRPAIKVEDNKETEVTYIIEKFDADKLETRAQIFTEHLTVDNFLAEYKHFFDTAVNSLTNMKSSSPQARGKKTARKTARK